MARLHSREHKRGDRIRYLYDGRPTSRCNRLGVSSRSRPWLAGELSGKRRAGRHTRLRVAI